ncbi:hypothetical protein A0H81_09552 [Grifola frondosa]|uniref:Uncharacterized protein n=1 Tax=Grifola frondosa TaxID=5627 RepID=A0A1C7M0Q4_GRIFR|nr:hypothetical protein A0H81_09552 [Grifola frondosa]
MSTELDTFPKQTPPDGNLFWRLTGSENVVMNNGAPWRRLSRVVRAAFERNLPIEQFELLARRLFVQMGEGGRLRWDDFTMRYTLDAIGTCALGHDFDAIGRPRVRL